MKIIKPKGTNDRLPEDIYEWQYIESKFSEVCRLFNFKEIRTPIFEYTELFQRGVGDSTDIVQKEMYTFEDKGGRSITLRPEGTAGVVRSYIENGMASLPQPIKVFYNITAYRYENVQKGRYREFNQLGVEAFGSKEPQMDIEVISLLFIYFDILKIKNIKLSINSIGCPDCREEYNKKLKEFYKPKLNELCNLCNERYDRNPLRLLDCKGEDCKEINKDAPMLLDYLCDECRDHFKSVTYGLDNLGIKYIIDKTIVRGLDYYTKTVFEFISENVGTQGTICAGGRYDKLVEKLGGKDVPAVGFAVGSERLLMEIKGQTLQIPKDNYKDIYIAVLGEKATALGTKLVYELRYQGIKAETDLANRSLKAQMKYANKMGFKYVVVIGDKEVFDNKAALKNMEDGNEKEITLNELSKILK